MVSRFENGIRELGEMMKKMLVGECKMKLIIEDSEAEVSMVTTVMMELSMELSMEANKVATMMMELSMEHGTWSMEHGAWSMEESIITYELTTPTEKLAGLRKRAAIRLHLATCQVYNGKREVPCFMFQT